MANKAAQEAGLAPKAPEHRTVQILFRTTPTLRDAVEEVREYYGLETRSDLLRQLCEREVEVVKAKRTKEHDARKQDRRDEANP